ncbi:V-type ATP synthase subunit D [Candidatus Woesearchaeota archaeon]|nr:V-type ATP synthase subunit D [Candidatus Woesearchaeota archaeon]
MATIKPTRMELLLLRKKLKLAGKGHDLLKRKQDVLVLEFFNVLKEIKGLRARIAGNMIKAQNSLYNAQAIEGELNIERTALGLSSGASIELASKSIMGVEIPVIKNIEVQHEWHGYFGQTIELDNAVKQYRDIFPELIRLMEKQLVLKHLAEETKKTKRRVNSLEYLTIPRLEKTKKIISFKLEELERENFSRLKKIKKTSAK